MATTRRMFDGPATGPGCSCVGGAISGVRGELPESAETRGRATEVEREWLGCAAVVPGAARQTEWVRSFASYAVDAKSAADECGVALPGGAQKPTPAHRKMFDESLVRPLPRDHWLQGTIIRRRGGGER